MHPYLFSIPLPWADEPFHLRTFGLLVAAGFLLGAHLLQRFAARFGDDPQGDPERFSRTIMWILVGVFGGARLMYVVVEILRHSETGQSYLDEPWTMLFFWEGGLVMYGGLIGGIGLGLVAARREKLRPIHALDMGLVAGFFGQAVGRVGCLMVGDDFGSVVPEKWRNLPFPITVKVPDVLPEGSLFGPENAGQVLWATQIWMSLNALLLAYIGYRILVRRRYAGQVSLWLVLLYSVARFVIEAFRGDGIRGVWFDGLVSTSQLISVVGFVVAAILLWRNRQRVDAQRGDASAGEATA
ncbi:MAG: prolipoprotein diacylglyceryl transferase [Planctomycetes bacterium]|nr:prolipoprotein diacylglyceryl transferase [Planctomycetota bacterium]